MDTVIVASSQFYSHYPKRIPRGTVNAEAVLVRLDPEWEGLTVRIHWLNVASDVEKVVLLDRDQPNTIPWEVLAGLGELRMGLDGMDGGTVVKPTVWLTYGYVVDGVDPESGSDPQPPTPSWEQQMVEQATQANQAAQAAQKAAEEAAESVASAGPYAEEAKKSAEAAKASQDAAATSAQQANEAAQTAQNAAGSIGDAVKRAEDAATAAGAAQRAAENAQAGAAQSAGTAQTAATTAGQAAQDAQSAATQAGQYLTSVEADANAAAAAATAAGKSQDAAQGAAQTAANARDQATTAANTAQGHATAASTAKDAAEQAAATAGSAQSGAAQSAQAAANSAKDAEVAKQEAQKAAAVLPTPSKEFAGMAPVVNQAGNGYIFGKVGGGESTQPIKALGRAEIKEEVAMADIPLSASCNEIIIIISAPAYEGRSTLNISGYVNDIPATFVSVLASSFSATVNRSIKVSSKLLSVFAENEIRYGSNFNALASVNASIVDVDLSAGINKLRLTSNKIVADTTVEIYGRMM